MKQKNTKNLHKMCILNAENLLGTWVNKETRKFLNSFPTSKTTHNKSTQGKETRCYRC